MKRNPLRVLATCRVVSFMSLTAADAKTGTAPKTYLPNSKSNPRTTTMRTDRPLRENSLVALVLVGLLGFKWILRRRYGPR